jgi:hypothetical protein
MSIRLGRAYGDVAKGWALMADTPCRFCKYVAITIAVLLVASVCLGIAVGYLNERGSSVADMQIKSPGLDGAMSKLAH